MILEVVPSLGCWSVDCLYHGPFSLLSPLLPGCSVLSSLPLCHGSFDLLWAHDNRAGWPSTKMSETNLSSFTLLLAGALSLQWNLTSSQLSDSLSYISLVSYRNRSSVALVTFVFKNLFPL